MENLHSQADGQENFGEQDGMVYSTDGEILSLQQYHGSTPLSYGYEQPQGQNSLFRPPVQCIVTFSK